MKYIPKITRAEIIENNKHFKERISLYKGKGLDFSESLKDMLKKASPLEGNVLEIGTGRGHTALFLSQLGYKFTTIDKDKESLKITSLNLAYSHLLDNVQFYVMDANKLSFKDKSFKNIIAVNFFHHIKNAKKTFSEIDRVLRINGKIIFTDFNKKGMKIIDNVHREEKRVHENLGTTKKEIYDYFYSLKYNIKLHEHNYYWFLVGTKK